MPTDAAIKALSLPKGVTDQIVWLDKGFGVRLRRRGESTSKTFVFQYKFGEKQRRVSIGEWPTMKLRAAHDRWEDLRGQLKGAKIGRAELSR